MCRELRRLFVHCCLPSVARALAKTQRILSIRYKVKRSGVLEASRCSTGVPVQLDLLERLLSSDDRQQLAGAHSAWQQRRFDVLAKSGDGWAIGDAEQSDGWV